MEYGYYLNRNFLAHEHAQEIAHLSLPAREAFLFKCYLSEIPIHIHDGDQLAGWHGYENGYPEEQVQFSQERHQAWLKKERTEEEKIREILSRDYCVRISGNDHGHIMADYAAMLSRGTRAYIRDVEERLAREPEGTQAYIYLTAMKEALAYGEIFSARFADLAAEKAKQTDDPQEKERLLRMEKACRKLPMEPAEDFYEALQSIFLLYCLVRISDSGWVSVSFGSFDQYMYPYYLKSKAQGMTDADAEKLLLELFQKLDMYEGRDCALSIGGLDLSGNDLTNELSYVILSAEKKNPYRSPLFSLRISPKTPEKLLDGAICSVLFEKGQPTFYSELTCRKAVMSRGLSEETAAKYQIHTCMTLAFPGEQVDNAWGVVMNVHLPLELALNGGKPLRGELPISLKTTPRTHYESTQEIYDQFRLYYQELFDYCRELCTKDTKEGRLAAPNPWLSSVTADCIEKGLDRWDEGAKYQNVVIEQFGFANAADAIGAVEKLVFEEKKYTLAQMLEAASQNYIGYEEMLHDIMECPKYGMNIPQADLKARTVLEIVSDICEASWHDSIYYLPSLHTLHSDVESGLTVHAMLDGRRDGEPFNKNAGPTHMARRAGPTATMLSACALNQVRLSGGQALDVHFSVGNMDDPMKRRKIAALIRTYLTAGGLQLQVNGLSAQTLQKAYDAPEQYEDLIVRIGGHSRYFNELSNEVKKEFIHRISIEERAGG